MAEGAPREQLRLALSWREQAARHAQQVREAAHHGEQDLEAAAYREAELSKQAHEAQKYLDAVRRECQAHVQALGRQLQRLLQDQQELAGKVAARQLTPQQANDANRTLATQIDILRRDIHEANRLCRAERAEEAGGFIALPLEQYRRMPLAAPAAADVHETPGWWRGNRRTILIAAAVLILAVVGALLFLMRGRNVEFSVLPQNDGENILVLECTNHRLQEIILNVPWLAGQTRTRNEYGVDLLVRETEDAAWELYHPPVPVWLREGIPTSQLDPLRVMPGLSQRVELNVLALRELLPELAGLRILCTRGATEIYSHQVAQLPPALWEAAAP